MTAYRLARLAIALSIVTLVLCGLGAGRAPQPPATAPVADPDPARFAKAIDEFERWDSRNSPPDSPVLFVGSSTIVGWKTHESFPKLPVINRGFGGAHLSDVLHYFDRVVKPYPARVILLYAGDNDIADGKTPERLRDDYRTFVQRVRALLPDTPVIYISIKPSTLRWAQWPQMKAANALIKEMSDASQHLYFADTATPTLGEDGTPRKQWLKDDGLHLSDEGYRQWTGIVAPLIEQALKAK